jgi:hypothetical protein
MDESKHNGNSHAVGDSHRIGADRTWTEIIKDEPIACLAIAGAAGFLLGGGLRRVGGLTVLTMLGQLVVREAFANSALGDLVDEAIGT